MQPHARFVTALLVGLILVASQAALADDPDQREVDARLDSGLVINTTNERAVIWSGLIKVPGVAWLSHERELWVGKAVGFNGRGKAFARSKCGHFGSVADWRHRVWLVERSALDDDIVNEHAIILAEQLLDPDFWPRFGIAIFSGLGILPLLLAWRARATAELLRNEPHWGVLIVCGLAALAGGVDKARLFLPMTPAIVVIAVQVCQPALHAGARSARALAWLILTLLLNAYLGHHFEPMGEAGAGLARLAPIHAEHSLGEAGLRVAIVAGLWLAATASLRPLQPVKLRD